MSRETVVFIAGILLTVVPFLGVPENWRQYTVFGIGIILIIVGFSLRRRLYLTRIDIGNGERGDDSFIETTEKLFEDHDAK